MGLQDAKLLLMGFTSLDKDALHIYVGLGVYLAATLLSRRPLGDLRPLVAVAVVALLGETWDLVDNVRTSVPMQWAGHWHDIWNTLFWPAGLTALGRFAPLLTKG